MTALYTLVPLFKVRDNQNTTFKCVLRCVEWTSPDWWHYFRSYV